MTDIREMINVMTGYSNGLRCQRHRWQWKPDLWEYDEHPVWNWDAFDYRIEPFSIWGEEIDNTYGPKDLGDSKAEGRT